MVFVDLIIINIALNRLVFFFPCAAISSLNATINMSSHLTRHVFRCLIANEPILHNGCIQQHARSTLRRYRAQRVARRSNAIKHHRTMFNFAMFKKQPQDMAATGSEPGIDFMADLVKRRRVRARLPALSEVQAAMNAYLTAKEQQKMPVMPDTQARLLLQSLEHIGQEMATNTFGEETQQEKRRLLQKLGILISQQHKDAASASHTALARHIFTALADGTGPEREAGLSALVYMLCFAGQPQEARDVLVEAIARAKKGVTDNEQSSLVVLGADVVEQLYQRIILSFSTMNNEAEILKTLELGDAYQLSQKARIIDALVVIYAMQRSEDKMQEWLVKWHSVQNKLSSRIQARTVREVLTCYSELEHQDIGHRFVHDMMVISPAKNVWNEILAWGLGQYRSVEEVDRMLDVMLASNKNNTTKQPDINTINRLVETAIALKDPYTAERLINLGKSRGIEPDAKTLVLQMEYRLSVKDIDGALVAYKHLQSKDLSSNEDVPAVNRLIVALGDSTRHDYDTIMNVAADLSDRRASFDARTVKTLGLIHLKRDELQDFQDLIKTHAHRFSFEERKDVIKAITRFCVSPDTPTASMWDAYHVLRNDFDEIARKRRTALLQNCFDRKRPDMAVHIFNHMRMHSRKDTQPDSDTYATAFLGAAQLDDQDTLEVFRNQLKLDVNIEVDTKLRNALMLAYIRCGAERQAITIWDDIVASREGPTHSSIEIALYACEAIPFGDVKASQIWQRLQRNNIETTQKMWTSYVAAVAGNGDIQKAIDTISSAVEKDEAQLDTTMLGRIYNAALETGKQDQIQTWAQATYPEVWEKLQKVKVVKHRYGGDMYDIDRDIQP